MLWPGSAAASAVGQRQAQSPNPQYCTESMMHLHKHSVAICNIGVPLVLGFSQKIKLELLELKVITSRIIQNCFFMLEKM